jgi:hypothetical protein
MKNPLPPWRPGTPNTASVYPPPPSIGEME